MCQAQVKPPREQSAMIMRLAGFGSQYLMSFVGRALDLTPPTGLFLH
jgi:hypothetical protein